MSTNILKIQNQGNISTNLRLLYEMRNAGDDLHDAHGYYTKKDVARIAVTSFIVTTEGQVDVDELLRRIDDDTIAETDNAILQNVKQRLQILRQFGLVSTDYSSEIYAITELGEQMLRQVYGPQHCYSLLMELFVNLNTTTEVYDNKCTPDFECYLGFEICYAFSKLDHRISTLEMCIIPTYSIGDIDSFVIGYDHPTNDTLAREFIETAHEKWGINIVASNLRSLLSLCIRKVWDNEQIDLKRLLGSYGIINE